MIDVVCLKVGTKYGPEYVNRLFAMVQRNMNSPHRFVCITDDPSGILPAVKTTEPEEPQLEGWWHKLTLFKPLAGITDRVIFLDLDTVIVGNIDFLTDYRGPLALLDDFYHKGHLATGIVLMASTGVYNEVWQEFKRAPDAFLAMWGDQQAVEHVFRCRQKWPDILQSLYPEKIVSYKVHCQNALPAPTRLVCFHGHPRPHEADAAWIERYWRE